jgi:hypothetical protein
VVGSRWSSMAVAMDAELQRDPTAPWRGGEWWVAVAHREKEEE